jgi:RNA polymerase sigma factor (sigma-70 family)
MDAIQEANLAALSALPSWEPVRGTLATWLVPHIRGALLDYANTHTSGGIGSKHNKLIQVAIDEVVASEELLGAPDDNPFAETTEQITLEDSLTYDGDVLPNSEREALLDQIRQHAWVIRNGNLLMEHFLGDASIKTLSIRYNKSQDTIRRRIDQAIKDLRRHIEVGDAYSCGIC